LATKRSNTTADTTSIMPAEAARKVPCYAHEDFLREAVQAILSDLMKIEVTKLACAGFHEDSENRLTRRNGDRPRSFDTRVGTFELEIPRLHKGSHPQVP
jgi:transposase-like protein